MGSWALNDPAKISSWVRHLEAIRPDSENTTRQKIGIVWHIGNEDGSDSRYNPGVIISAHFYNLHIIIWDTSVSEKIQRQIFGQP